MFQGSKGYIAMRSTPAVWKQYNKMAVLTLPRDKQHLCRAGLTKSDNFLTI